MKAYLYAAIGAAIIGGLGYWTYTQRQDAAEDARAAIERENTNAANKADGARVSMRECVFDLGGVYQFETGKCDLSAVGR